MWMFLFWVLPVLSVAYIAWHIWVLLPLSTFWKSMVIAAGVFCIVLLFLHFRRSFEHLPLPVAQAAYEIGTSSLFVILYLVVVFLVFDLGRLFRLIPKTIVSHNSYTSLIVFILLFGLFLYGNVHYKNKVRVPLELKSSKSLARTYKVVMASDLHLGYHNTRKELARWVDMINEEKPDFILIAGDIIDGSIRPLVEERMTEEFRRLKAPVYACLGNHEYFSGEPQARQFYHDAGIRLLIDEAAVVDSSIVIIGRDDRTNRNRMSVRELMADSVQLTTMCRQSPYIIVLDHQPYHLEYSEAAGVDFQLSGHTHRGQVWPISWITDAIYECSWGTCHRGHTQYYVSSGLGIWGGKFRIGTQSEYVVATISN